MTVYVDLLFGINAVINYLLLRGSAAIGGCPANWGRLTAAAVVGGFYAVASVVQPSLQSAVFQGICAGLMLLIAFGWKRNTIKQGLFFFALSFAFGGVVLLAVQLVEPDCMILNGRVYYGLSMSALLLLAGISYGVAALVLSGCGAHTGGDLVDLQLHLGQRQTTVRALRDTGNVLRDPMTGQAVLVADSRTFQRLIPDFDSSACRDPAAALPVLAARHPGIRFRLIPYRTVGVENGLLLALRCRCSRKKREEQVLVACSPTAVSSDGRFEAIWGGEII